MPRMEEIHMHGKNTLRRIKVLKKIQVKIFQNEELKLMDC